MIKYKKNKKVTYILLNILICLSGTVKAQKITAWGYSASLVCDNFDVMVWGRNNFGQLGDGTTVSKNAPVKLNSFTNVKTTDGGEYHSLFLKNDGTVWASGKNDRGQLGDGTYINRNTPVQINSLSDIVAIDGGETYSLFLKNDGTVWACGREDIGELGLGPQAHLGKNIPVQISSLSDIISISAGQNHALFLKRDGTVWACGSNNYGELGNGTYGGSMMPIQIMYLNNVIAIAAGQNHSLFLKSDGTVFACGDDYFGALGSSSQSTTTNTVVQVAINNVVKISAYAHSLFLKNDGTAWSCGYNYSGELGWGSSYGSYRDLPGQVTGISDIIHISAGWGTSVFQKNNGTAIVMGNDSYGQQGNGPGSGLSYLQFTTLCETLGLEENVKTKGIEIYPNPNNGVFYIEQSSRERIINKSIIIYNSFGQKVYERRINDTSKFEIDLRNEPKGFYFYELFEKNEILKTGKLVIF
ncbi:MULTISPECIES: T9SS type A sorting domain-containing protein [Flavobacterium]|uniref:RCC1 domain-containing protein n=1 Tax=Flavobacterium TaxID=237 RepID=UPI001FCC882A|nr:MULTISPECIES: T9SS type A sorting domain-containing protein [Flavobacterium]UOK41965.1 T9SS type A sorting domain-containing protein [Flavobacterium enshiense]